MGVTLALDSWTASLTSLIVNPMVSIRETKDGNANLHSAAERDAAGNIDYPFGSDAIGTIMYDNEGCMAVQICRKERNHFSSEKLKEATIEDALVLTQDYLAYFGYYTIDEENNLLTHILQGNLHPNLVGQTVQRQFKFYENKLLLCPYHDGTDREILWEKESSPSNRLQ